jgi:prolyl 3-hydroxylase /prolyl 3,4-dihydroxylase
VEMSASSSPKPGHRDASDGSSGGGGGGGGGAFRRALHPHLDGPSLAAQIRASHAATAEKPFSHGVVDDFLSEELLGRLRSELSQLDFARKSNDLYDFFQTRLDLASVDLPAVNAVRDLIYAPEMRKALGKGTGARGIRAQADIFCARYGDTHTLLAHDDDESSRRIAFILYLVDEDWDSERDGGELALMGSDLLDQPREVETVISPKSNRLAWLEVDARSWHQVCEVTTQAKERVSITGWWHGPVPAEIAERRRRNRALAQEKHVQSHNLSFQPVGSVEPVKRASQLNIELVSESSSEEEEEEEEEEEKGQKKGQKNTPPKKKKKTEREKAKNKTKTGPEPDSGRLLRKWVNPLYLQAGNQAQIRAHFEAECSISLAQFLEPGKYARLVNVVDQHAWEIYGPLHRRHYQRLVLRGNRGGRRRSNGGNGNGKNNNKNKNNKSTMMQVRVEVAEVAQLLLSSEFAALLHRLTGQTVDAVSHQIRRFSQGSYTLAQDCVETARGLDCVLSCATGPIPVEHGGQLVYMDADEELLSEPAQPNTLVLVLRDPGTMRFVKYLNHRAKDVRFDFALEFRGPGFDEESSSSESSSAASQSGYQSSHSSDDD